jgi:hypothetical protein
VIFLVHILDELLYRGSVGPRVSLGARWVLMPLWRVDEFVVCSHMLFRTGNQADIVTVSSAEKMV